MSAELIVANLLNVSAITSEVEAVALEQLPQGTKYPAIVYNVVYCNTLDYLCAHGKNYMARVQINPLADSMIKVNELHKLIKTAMVTFQPKNIAGLKLTACTFYGYTSASKDDQGIWTKPADYRLIFEEI
jgi:hypothetical protein